MRVVKPSVLDTEPLLAVLARRFPATAPDGIGPDGVPPELWERALLGPLREFLSRPGKEVRARLVELGFMLGGGRTHEMPAELPLLVEILHAGSLIIDDIEDDSPQRRGRPALHRVHGLPIALNAGNWLYFWPQALLSEMALPAHVRLQAHERIAACLLRCHEGQALDLTVRVVELAPAHVPGVAHTVTALKTGELVGLATALGALAARSNPRRTEALSRFGCDVGVGLQMLDDLSGVLNPARRDDAVEDLHLGRVTWVWAWLAEELDAADYAALLDAIRRGDAGDASGYDAVLRQARFRLSMTGLRRVRRHFDAALTTLERTVGGGTWQGPVRADLDWLEREFLEAPS